MARFTLEDHDNLADVAWWIKGHIAAGGNDFAHRHSQSFENIMTEIKAIMREEKKLHATDIREKIGIGDR